VVSGGLACIVGAVILARLLPGFRKQRRIDDPEPEPGPGPGQGSSPAQNRGT